MPKPHKFRPGPQIRSPGLAATLIEAGEWLYWNHKPQHPSWMRGMTLHSIIAACYRGTLRLAIPTQEKPQ